MTCATSRVVSRSSSNVSKTEEDFDEEQKPLCSNKEANNDRNESSSSPLKTTRDDDSSTAAVSWRCCNVYTIVFRCVLLVCLLSGIQFACSKALLHHQTQQRIPEGVKRFKGPPRVKDPNFKPQSKYIFQGALVSHFPDRAKDAETTKQKNTEMLALFNENHTITVADLSDLDPVELPANVTWDEAAADRGPILRILQRAGLRVDVQVLQRLPTWSQVTRLYGAAPVVVVPKGNGEQDSCAAFRARVPVATRFVGVAGQMNTGTNAISKYLAQNIEIAENNASTSKGILWTVPWYKHGWASLRFRYKYRFPEDHANVLAVVLIRDPYFWMQRYVLHPFTPLLVFWMRGL